MPRSLIIDTNLLILLAVDYCDKSKIGHAPRVAEFEPEHFDMLIDYTSNFERIILCPNILTETSNLLAKFKGELGIKLRHWIKQLVAMHDERYIASREAASEADYLRLGLTDAVLLALCKNDVTLIATDHNLYQAALNKNQKAINFWHLLKM